MNLRDNSLSRKNYVSQQEQHWNSVANDDYSGWNGYYHKYLEQIYQHIIPAGLSVLEIGCGKGDLLAAINPDKGVGVDQSGTMVKLAQKRHPELQFIHALGEEIALNDKFDVIILSDLLNSVWDVQELLANLSGYCNDSTRIVVNAYSRLWQPMLDLTRKLQLATPMLPQNWLTVEDLENLFYLEGFDTIKSFSEFVFPLEIPILSKLVNKYFARIFPFRFLCLTNFLVIRKQPLPIDPDGKLSVSIVVAARNEEGNIPNIFKRTPELGAGTELIFVEGGSKDNTFDAIKKEIKNNPGKNAVVYQQSGVGKGDAVRLGLKNATGDILMILDADLTVAPENLYQFFDAIASGKGEFINGVRLVYPMEGEAMRFWNLVGNKIFSLAFSWLLGQSIKDTLCGTKVLTKENYQKIVANQSYFGDFDPFGDFDLIFGAAKQNLKIVDLPVRYHDRQYGETNISRWRHGLLLLRMVAFAASKIKFHG